MLILREEHLITFGSMKLIPRGIKYSVIEEGHAIVEGIKHFQVYQEGLHFLILTYYNYLVHMSASKDNPGTIAR